MDQATLLGLGPDIQAGSEVVSALEEADIKVALAMYMLTSEHGDWQLALASPSFDQDKKPAAYERIFYALEGKFSYNLPQMVVLPMKDPLVRELRKLFGHASDVTGMRLGGQTIGNRFIEDAYVYRVQ